MSLARFALLSCSLALTFHTCLPASRTKILIPHLKPFDAASTPLANESKSNPSTLAAYCVFGLTSLSNISDERNSAKLYHLSRLEGMVAGSPTLLCAKAFSEQRSAYFSILEFSSLEANRANFTHNSACSSNYDSSCSLGFHPSSPSKHFTIWFSQSALLGEFCISSN